MGARVAFRADSSQELGYGHVMRCLTLANELKLGGAQCSFFSRATPAALRELISLGGHELVEMPRESSSASDGTREDPDFLVSELPEVVDWLVVDHYGIDASWERAARASARRILVIDDLANRSHDCELLLDQNFNSQGSARYAAHIPQSCRPLLGPQFALLRPEFMQARKCAKPRTGQVERLFVFFGGADAADCTSAALAALSRLEHEWQSVDVVIGAQHRNRNRIAELCNRQGFRLHVQTPLMADLMCEADLALGAGGSTSWERCCVGLPALLVAVADNQQALVRDSEVAGFAFAPAREGSYEDFFARNLQILVNDPARIREMSRRAMELVDGKGATRVRRAMGVTSMNMRPASPADARHIFEWRNHADVRRYSINSESIDWETHRSWFEKTLERPDRVLLIGEASGHPAGVVRFDIEGCTAEISIYKVPGASALLPGGELLAAAESWLAARHPEVHQLTATVLRENEVSRFLFLSAGYSAEGTRFSKRTRA